MIGKVPYDLPLTRRTTAWAAIFIGLLLTSLIAGPLLINVFVERHRDEVRYYIEPSQRIVYDLEVALSRSLSGLQGFQATGRNAFVELYRDQNVRIDELLTRLRPISEHLGAETTARYEDLRRVIDRWRHAVDQNELAFNILSADELRQRLFTQDHLLDNAHQTTADFQLDLDRIREVHRERIDSLSHFNIVFTIVLAGLSLIAVVMVWRIMRKVRSNAQDLSDRVRQELVLREISTTVIEAVKLSDVLRRIVRGAISIVDAEGGFIEKIDVEGDKITVAARYGNGPELGESAPYRGSLAEAVIRSGEHRIINEISQEAGEFSRVVRQACGSCAVLAVPMVADEQPVGVLFLLRKERTFTDQDVEPVALLVIMAALSLRKTLLLDAAERGRKQAERAVRSRDEMLRVVSHDLRNPLGNIAVAATLLRQKDSNAEERDRLLEMIHRLTSRMNRIIQDLVDIARAESGQTIPLELQEVSARALLEEACTLNRINAEKKKIRLEYGDHAEGVPLYADRHRILQALSNLVDNAVKFSPENGVVWLNAELEGDVVQFTVTDTGSGIPESQMKEIFAPFWRDVSRPEAGIGLGLAIVKRIAEMHGGGASVRNEPGAGATFSFWLPSKQHSQERIA